MTLTEQWKNGELPSRDDEHEWLSYYIKHNDGYIHADSYWRGKWGIADRNSIAEILAPVPTYQEYLESEAHCAVYSEENKRLKAEIERLQFENQHVIWLKHRNEALDKDNKQLKELLKECQHMIIAYSINNNTFTKDEVKDIITKTDEVLK